MEMSVGLTFLYAVIGGAIPSILWLIFWLREDVHKEPRWLIAETFFGGMLAVIIAIILEKIVAALIIDETLRYTLWAAIEEILKFAAAAFIALNTKFNDEPIDAMMYCIIVALGFAAVENTLFITTPLSSGAVAQSIVTGNLRFIGATLVHIVCSAIIGFSAGLYFYKSYLKRTIATIVGILVAVLLHAGFNLSIINATGVDTLKSFAWVWGAVVILIVLFEEIKVVHPKFIK